MHLWMCLLMVSSLCAKTKAQSKVVCYFDSWSLTRTGDDQYRIEDIDPSLCTHVIYAFADLASDGTIQVGDPSTDLPSGLDGYNRLNLLKQQNPNLKTLISIGGEDAGSAIFSRVFNSEELRAMFVDNAVIFVEENGFDGLDIDWEFPGEGTGSSTSDKVAFTDTLEDIRTKFTPLGLLLTVACSSPSYFLSGSYDVPSIAENVDFINLMTYDFHSSSELATGLNAPLYAREEDDVKELNVNWLNNGAPAEKIVLGMSFFGNAFTLRHPSDNGVGAPALGPAPGTEGILRYSQVIRLITLRT
uniref:GH18 domain-containing protein n=1 Tax=Timema douglasi TaxID=61478 RepID=A0A7R8VF80_TIMDO|nr:unnamed protein product [Timema douglasi]